MSIAALALVPISGDCCYKRGMANKSNFLVAFNGVLFKEIFAKLLYDLSALIYSVFCLESSVRQLSNNHIKVDRRDICIVRTSL